jgi:O-acetyl-ADP-ribose deacetylase (regulator of RNase III)
MEREHRVDEYRRDHISAPLIATGNAYSTSAGALPFKRIIHAVGPIWNGGKYHERELLTQVHRRALQVAADDGCASIAFPAISCGIFGFPIKEAAQTAIYIARQVKKYGGPTDIEFWLFDEESYCTYVEADCR